MSGGWIFLDLDGPLLDVSPRYHRVHADLVLRRGGRPLAPEAYWQAKRDRVAEQQILEGAGLSPQRAAEAAAARLRCIESRRYLRFDRPWPWTVPTLATLAQKAPLLLVTLRRRGDLLAWQLRELDLLRHVGRVVAGPGDGTVEAKARLVREAGIAPPPGSLIVGDTEIDVASGRALGLRTVAVRSGIRSDAQLARWEPDLLLDDLSQLPGHLAALGWP